MKNLINLLFIALFYNASFTLHAQITLPPNTPCQEEGLFVDPSGVHNLSTGRPAYQSSNATFGGQASLALDGVVGTGINETSKTSLENNPWWEVDLGVKSILTEMRIWYNNSVYPQGVEGSYILFSEIPFGTNNLNEILASPAVRHIHVQANLASGHPIPINSFRSRYVRIQKSGYNSIGFSEVSLRGIPGDPYGGGEECSNGIDDDNDCKTDCADTDCSPAIWGVSITHPSCKNCNDGSITIKANSWSGLEFSIDGGITFTSCSPTGLRGYCTFDGLTEGNYVVKVRNAYCESSWGNNPIVLRPPAGNPSTEKCNNGSFESGSEQGWLGASGTNNSGTYNIQIPNITDFNVSPQHQILSNVMDPITNANIRPVTGNFFAQIGNRFSNADAASIRYCLTVNPSNAQNSFWYYLVLEDGSNNHALSRNPYFEYRVVDNSGAVLNTFNRIIADLNNPFFQQSPSNGIVYRDWTCQTIDLTPWMGQEICIEFIAADCSEGGHLGYAYIDAFCTESPLPSATLVAPDVFCLNQPVNVVVNNEFLLNRYQWIIERIDPATNNVLGTCTLPVSIASNVPTLVDALSFYRNTYPNYNFNCQHRFRIRLKMFTDCNESETSKIINFSCNAIGLNYPDILVCDNNQDVQITGVTNCPNCTYEWAIANDPYNTQNPASAYLSDITSPYPTIRGTLNLYAFDMTYLVTVRTPEGCVYTDEVVCINTAKIQALFGSDETSTCTFDKVSCLKFIKNIDFQKYFDIKYYLQGNYGQFPTNTPFENIPKEEIPLTFLTPTNSLTDEFCFQPTLKELLRGFKQRIGIKLTFKNNASDVRIVGQNCTTKEFSFTRDSDSPYFGDVNISVPNIFSPNSSTPANTVVHPFFTPNVYEAWFKVFNRWGAQVHQGHVVAQNNQPLSVAECRSIGWDGYFNGQIGSEDVYTYVVDFQNCQVSPANCFDNNANSTIAPHIGANESNSTFQVGSIARGVKVTAYTSGNTTVFNCGYFSPPNNKITNYTCCPAIFNCSDAAHAGNVFLVW